MGKLKRIALKEDNLVCIKIPISTQELNERKKQYDLLLPKKFAFKFKSSLFEPIELYWKGQGN
ncbi:hypothetical protein ACFSTA_15985 [Ornithinibacillus salinisoli]|uniref:Uncharacterized protein n=1 Tax=Ornithinibacillus salinisoli TaxID=1848459 RepID=A0ABW4W2U8_9BACI